MAQYQACTRYPAAITRPDPTRPGSTQYSTHSLTHSLPHWTGAACCLEVDRAQA